jgi:hypothetical protein
VIFIGPNPRVQGTATVPEGYPTSQDHERKIKRLHVDAVARCLPRQDPFDVHPLSFGESLPGLENQGDFGLAQGVNQGGRGKVATYPCW